MAEQKFSGFAIAGFVCSLLFVPLLGIIFSAIALNQIKKNNLGGKGLALAGLIIGIVESAIYLIFWTALMALFSSLAAL